MRVIIIVIRLNSEIAVIIMGTIIGRKIFNNNKIQLEINQFNVNIIVIVITWLG